MPLPPLPSQIADHVNVSREKQPDLKNPPKKVKKLATSSVWVENEGGVEELDHDLSAAEEALERIKTDAPAQYLEKKLEAKNERSKRTIRTGPPSLFVLDTNVLMHDPSSLFRFEEHDLYLPMTTLEELDNHKKGMSEVARNARMVSRSLDQLIAGTSGQLDEGIPLNKLGNQDATGRLFFQTHFSSSPLPEGLPVSYTHLTLPTILLV